MTDGRKDATQQGSGQHAEVCTFYAVTTNVPGYSPEGDRVVAAGEQDAAESMRDFVDGILDHAVESEQMSEDEASSDLASILAAIADGDLQHRMRRDGGASWLLADLNLVVCATPIKAEDLDADEREYLDLPEPTEVPEARIDAVKALALAWLNGGEYRTTWSLGDPEFETIEGDAEDGSEDRPDPANCTIVAQDLGHASNVLVLTIEGDEVIEAN